MTTSTAPLNPPVRIDRSSANHQPGVPRLVAVELRKMVDTRAGFWLQAAIVALTAAVVIARIAVGEAADHDFASILDAGVTPAAVLLPVVGVLLVTSEWSQRTGLITFVLVPARPRILLAKLMASLVLSVAMLAVVATMVAIGTLASSSGAAGAWTDAPTLVGQTAIFLAAGMVTAIGFGAILLASAPALVALFALPIAWSAIAALPVFADAAPWIDTRLALAPMHQVVLTGTQWAHAATALAIWMALPLLIGVWRISSRPVAV